MHPRTLLSRCWPLLAFVALGLALFWLRPERQVSAAAVTLAYLAGCALVWRRQRRQKPPARPLGDTLVAYASQGGQAHELAWRSAEQLRQGGLSAECRALADLSLDALPAGARVLFVVSTYGEGEAPDNGARFERRLLADDGRLDGLRYAVLALGDRRYPNFCGFGRRLERRLHALGAEPLFDAVEVDRLDGGALRHWQHELAQLTGHTDFADWQPPLYQPWRLHSRTCLNPGSQGWPVFLLGLVAEPELMHWQAGDIAEIGPRQAPARVERFLRALDLNPTQPAAPGQTLAEALAERQLPGEPDDCRGLSPRDLLERLAPLAHREYSIASTPADGRLELLVRLMHTADGEPGIGSGWLCRAAEVGQPLALRIRRNPGFHGPTTDTPMILIGNGTGLAGLLAHLRERQAHPGSRNWLLFGERSTAHDRFCREQLDAWRASGHLNRLDLAFSRDQTHKRYVQDLLREQRDELRRWVDGGAAIYLCGSLEGMGRDVQHTLVELLGEETVERLQTQGRYRRDLY